MVVALGTYYDIWGSSMRKDEKRCVGCKSVMAYGEFYVSTQTEDGRNRYCKQCCKVNRSLEAVRKRDKKSKISFRQRHRAGILGVECDTTITLVEVFRQSRGMCNLCGRWVPPGKASIDHTHPLSKGGTHTWGNVQLVHLVCNLRKGDR